jgi:hypothetical protein
MSKHYDAGHPPIIIETVLQCYYTPRFIPSNRSLAHRDAVNRLLRDEIILPNSRLIEGETAASYSLTEKGRAFVGMVLKTPYPVNLWADPRD